MRVSNAFQKLSWAELGEIFGNALLAQNMIIALSWIMEQGTGMYLPYAVPGRLDFCR